MYGRKTDVLSFTINRASPADEPKNKYLFDPLLTKPWLGIRLIDNYKARLASMRYNPIIVINQPQPVKTWVQSQEESIFTSGGLAYIPNAGLWAGLRRARSNA